ncbi:MAG TPA: thioredoxin fold domain-containing protein [Casimicrobiaceae bacterium]|nr:thioredoxin fold domain-containing protein [Casimicrobiaceae bacterium]
MILASAFVAFAADAAAQSSSSPRGTGRAAIARAHTLPLATNLAEDAEVGARGRKPILLFFDREECPYCERALREYLVPLSRDEWKDRALFRQVEMDRALPVIDFDGRPTTHAALAARYKATLSPTVLVVDGKGTPLSGPLVGLMTVDFYGSYLENALTEASKRMRR